MFIFEKVLQEDNYEQAALAIVMGCLRNS